MYSVTTKGVNALSLFLVLVKINALFCLLICNRFFGRTCCCLQDEVAEERPAGRLYSIHMCECS